MDDRCRAAAPREVVRVDGHDNLLTIRAKLEAVQTDRAWLIVPNDAPALRTPVEFGFVADVCRQTGLQAVVVSPDGARRDLARARGLKASRSVGSIPGTASSSPAVAGRLMDYLPSWVSWHGFLSMAIVALAGIMLVWGFFSYLPVMRVTVYPSTIPYSETIGLGVDPAVRAPDPMARRLPGTLLQVRQEVSGSVPATGTATVGKEKAKGQVTMVNGQNSPLFLPAGTTLVSTEGKRFSLDKDVQLVQMDLKGVTVAITAVEPGSGGNVPARSIRQIEGLAVPGVTVFNEKPTSGGLDTSERTVAEEDRAKLRQELLRRATEQALAELRARAGPERTVSADTLKVSPELEGFDQTVGSKADRLTGRLTAVATAVSFSNEQLKSLVWKVWSASLPAGYSPGRGSYEMGTPEVSVAQRTPLKVQVHATGPIVGGVDTRALAQALRGKSLEQAQAILAGYPGMARAASIVIWPALATRADRVEIRVASGE